MHLHVVSATLRKYQNRSSTQWLRYLQILTQVWDEKITQFPVLVFWQKSVSKAGFWLRKWPNAQRLEVENSYQTHSCVTVAKVVFWNQVWDLVFNTKIRFLSVASKNLLWSIFHRSPRRINGWCKTSGSAEGPSISLGRPELPNQKSWLTRTTTVNEGNPQKISASLPLFEQKLCHEAECWIPCRNSILLFW